MNTIDECNSIDRCGSHQSQAFFTSVFRISNRIQHISVQHIFSGDILFDNDITSITRLLEQDIISQYINCLFLCVFRSQGKRMSVQIREEGPYIDPNIERSIQLLYPDLIKTKRVRKQLYLLLNSPRPTRLQIKSLSIKVALLCYLQQIEFQIKLDQKYPFTRPQIHCLDKSYPLISEGRDLLDLQLGAGMMWVPASILTELIDGIPAMMDKIMDGPRDMILGKYWLSDKFTDTELEQKGLKLFSIQLSEWSFLIKKSYSRILAISSNVVLLFQALGPTMFLQQVLFMKDVRSVRTNFDTGQMEVQFSVGSMSSEDCRTFVSPVQSNRTSKIYIVVKLQDVEAVLNILDPIQVLQKIVNSKESCRFPSRCQDLVMQYSRLIEHYSIYNYAKSTYYLQRMKALIRAQYTHMQ